MTIKAVNQSLSVQRHNNNGHAQSFTGSFNPVVALMDGIEKGGFAASFIAQDGIGMVAPRISEGLNRNRAKDENGKKVGPLNWEFARREGIREILSGPSAFLIPMGIMALLKKTSGTANNVHVDHINALGEDFANYALKNQNQLLENNKAFKVGYYTQVFENALSNSTDGKLNAAGIKEKASDFAKRLVLSEELRSGKNKNKKESKKLLKGIVEDYTKLRKASIDASAEEAGVVLKNSKELKTNITRLLHSMTDYSNDVMKKTGKYLASNANGNVSEYVKSFNLHRSGTRALSNFGMWGAVVGFYALIPKLYNMGLKHDPGLKGLDVANNAQKNDEKKDVSFTGNIVTKVGKSASDGNKLMKMFEFNGASMSIPAMLTLMFGFCLPPRYINAKSDHERKEILVRDITSFAAILFAAKALSRTFSGMFAKISGLALNTKPADHAKGFLHKVKNYFTAGDGINVLTSDQIVTKYSKIDTYRDGINGFFNFLEENGGNVKKVLSFDGKVKKHAEAIIREFNGKSLEKASMEEIHAAFKKARHEGSKALESIYETFSTEDNKFVTRAKTYNSAFGFASTLVLVPAFMMWLARYCEKMTKKAIAKEIEQKQTNTVNIQPQNIIATNKPSMAGFLSNK